MPGLRICLMRGLGLVLLALLLGSCDVLRTYSRHRKDQAAREKLRIADSTSVLIWSTPEGVNINSMICDQQGTTYVCCSDKVLYAIDQSGDVKWSFELGDRAWASPAVGPDGSIYVTADDGILYAIDSFGNLKWDFATDGRIYSSPTIGLAGDLFFGSGDGNLYAVTPEGSLNWSYEATHGIWSSPVIDEDGTVYFGSGDLYAVNPDGSHKWKFATDWKAEHAYRTGKDGRTYLDGPDPALAADGSIYFCWNNRMYQIDKTGKEQRTATRGRFAAVYTAGSEGSYYVVDKIRGFPQLLCLNQDGSTKWSFQAYTDINPPAFGKDGTVYIGSGDLRAIGPTGTELWWLDTANGKCKSPAIGADGTIFACSNNEVYAIPSELVLDRKDGRAP